MQEREKLAQDYGSRVTLTEERLKHDLQEYLFETFTAFSELLVKVLDDILDLLRVNISEVVASIDLLHLRTKWLFTARLSATCRL